MFEKSGKFFADWRDQRGERKRKSFHTERAALSFEAEQKELPTQKRWREGKRSPASYSPSSAPHRAALISFKPRVSSSEHADRFARSNSAPRTSQDLDGRLFQADSRAARKPLALVRSVASSVGSGKTTARRNSTATSAVTPVSARATTRPPAKKSIASSRQRRRT